MIDGIMGIVWAYILILLAYRVVGSYFEDSVAMFVSGIIAGLILAYTYIQYRRRSLAVRAHYPVNWDEIRQKVLTRDSYKCGNCEQANDLHVHHIIPLSRGGSNRITNLITLCKKCHSLLHPHMQ